MSKDALIPIEQREIRFYEDEILAVKIEGEEVYVPIRPICDLLGISWSGQNERIMCDLALSI